MKITAATIVQRAHTAQAGVAASRLTALLTGFVKATGVEQHPEAKRERLYGDENTLHGNEELSVEVNAHGRVVAVWFRCQALPFHQSNVSWDRCNEMRRAYGYDIPRLTAVHVVDNIANPGAKHGHR